MSDSLDFKVLGPLNAGAGSRALLALQTRGSAPRPAVLLPIPAEILGDPELTMRLRHETERALALEHPNVLRVFGLVETEGGLARAVEYANGETLRKILDKVQRMPAGLAARLVADVAAGVHFAHLAGNEDGSPLVHGDLRPETLMVSFDGVAKVSGYGALSVAPREPGGKRVPGRRKYAAPEQILGGRGAMTTQTDVFLLGLVLWEVLTGLIPFQDAEDPDQAVLTDELMVELPHIPEKLHPVLAQATAKKGKERFPTALALRDAIEEAVGPLPSTEELGAWLEQEFFADPERAALRERIAQGIEELRSPVAVGAPRTPPPPPADAAMAAAPLADAPEAPPSPPADATVAPSPAAVPPPTEAAVAPAPADPRAETSSGAQAAGDPAEAASRAAAVPEPGARLPVPPAAARPGAARSPSALRVLPLALASAALIGLASYWGPTAARLGLEGGDSAAVDESTADEAPGPDAPEEVLVAPAAPEPLAIEVAVLPPPAAAVRPAPSRPVASEETVEKLEVPALEDLTLPALEVSSVPELDVAVDGKPLGRTPFKKVVLPGRRTLTLTSKALGIRATREVEVKAQGITRLEVWLGTGTLSVNAPAGSSILIDGRLIGKLPLEKRIEVYEGDHHLLVDMGEARWEKAFSILEGEKLNYEVAVERRPRAIAGD